MEASLDLPGSRAAAVAVPAVGKCLSILRLLDAEPGAGLGLAAIAARLGLTKSHCLMILRTLVAEGWVAHDAERQRYAVSPGLLLDLAATIRRHDRGALMRDVVQRLARALGLPCLLCRINRDGSFTCVESARGDPELMIDVPIGHRYPADAPAQLRARLAALPAERATAVLAGMSPRAHTAATLTDRALIGREVEAARRQGFVIGRMEYLDGIMSIATAVCDAGGQPRMVLQCTGPQRAMTPREAALGQAVREAAARLALAWAMPVEARAAG
ncbi:IclR family transcriptional regulator [Roseomonas sp. KE0001]|uniref:IclR family transcriptional regulator n=1 Tax=Roseomonas sp. KE0001 TaxID=2479201 RepID=UPI0018DF5266|nr:IclR family transcriptional regulator C-terminal domain-containing protein [Roseomonas sp. KE0001]